MNALFQALHLPEFFRMARKTIKKEPIAQPGISDHQPGPAYEHPQPYYLPSSGDTVVDDDVVMDGTIDGYHTNIDANSVRQNSQYHSSSSWTVC